MREQQDQQRKQDTTGVESPGQQYAGAEYHKVKEAERGSYSLHEGTVDQHR